MITKSSLNKIMKLVLTTVAVGLISLSFPSLAQAQATTEKKHIDSGKAAKKLKSGTYVPPANVLVPESSKEHPADIGVRGHTNILIRKPEGDLPQPSSNIGSPTPAIQGQ